MFKSIIASRRKCDPGNCREAQERNSSTSWGTGGPALEWLRSKPSVESFLGGAVMLIVQ